MNARTYPFGLAILLSLAGCASWPKPEAEFYHATTRQQAIVHNWDQIAQGHQIATVGNTGSMRPWLTGGEFVACDIYHDQPLHAGMVVRINEGVGREDTIHMIADVTENAVYVTGINNPNSDGWFPKSSIRFIVREVIVVSK